ncbi:Glucosyl-3-phosphoglycerate synthase [Roseovarius albus]|uniref:Glucosyl-3-phosphoglycerate synthase n=1 Tax=Roseovarius albus TaxID=1247867 RepID=A0A1X6YLG0_9RHOB|nr:glycosyltransferase [Roseovarius albus]SLN24837.1 Glucosyl-3-phosphoglycerate synthase [Roseovarius albus]
MSDLISVIVPARNEAATIVRVVETLHDMLWVDEIVVIDNGSDDGTGDLALQAGATVVFEPTPGMGEAVRAGLKAARNDWVMKLDADLDKFQTALFARMAKARAPGIGLVKGAWNDPRDNMPMTRLLVGPAIRQLFPQMPDLRAPNTGIYLANRSLIAHQEIVGNYAADLDVMVRVHAAGAGIAEVDIGRLENNPRDVGHYNTMAETILAFFLQLQERNIGEELAVFADTGLQVANYCLSWVAAHARAGGRVNLYLGVEDRAVGVMRNLLREYPTVRFHSLSKGAKAQDPGVGSMQRIIAPYGESPASKLAVAYARDQHADVLSMPCQQQGFAANFGVARVEGQRIKARALDELGLKAAEQQAAEREVFQILAQ